MASVTICSDRRFGSLPPTHTQMVMSLTVSIVSPFICHEVMEQDVVILVFWMLSFKPAFSFSSFNFFKRLFSSSSLSARRVLSSVYMRLDNQSDNIQFWCSLFPILIKSIVPCPVLSVASWPAYRILRRQVRWSGNPSYFYIPCLTEIHLVKWQDLDIFNNNWHIFENPSKYENNDNLVVWSWSQRRYKKMFPWISPPKC